MDARAIAMSPHLCTPLIASACLHLVAQNPSKAWVVLQKVIPGNSLFDLQAFAARLPRDCQYAQHEYGTVEFVYVSDKVKWPIHCPRLIGSFYLMVAG